MNSIWRKHAEALGLEDFSGRDWGEAVSSFARENGGLGSHAGKRPDKD